MNWNCYKCGKEDASVINGFCICRKCHSPKEEEMKKNGKLELLPIEAVMAMLGGAILQNSQGNRFIWDRELGIFRNVEGASMMVGFEDLYHIPQEKTRLMTTFECLAWASSEESHGWLIAIINGTSLRDWVPPQNYSYSSDISKYIRARLLPDKSGIDESTIQGFEVEEEVHVINGN